MTKVDDSIPKVTLNLSPDTWDKLTNNESRERFRISTNLAGPPSIDRKAVLAGLDESSIIVSGWGSCPIHAEELEKAKFLKLIIYAAGSLREAFPEMKFPTGVTVTSAAHINARPVAEYTLGLILSSLRGAFTWTDRLREAGIKKWWELHQKQNNGYVDSCVAIVGFGLITKQLLKLLQPFSIRILVVSDFARTEDEFEYGFEKATLEDALPQADIVSLHEADLPPFHNLINEKALSSMKDGGILINTARGRLIDENALSKALKERPLLALLDVIQNEDQPNDNHPLLHLPNCFLTPHISGSVAGEIKRFGDYVNREIENFTKKQSLEGEIDVKSLSSRA